MATNPPITIGELADVPAPGSGVASAWCQEVTRRSVHRFATTAARDASYPAAGAGAGAVCVTRDTSTLWVVATIAGVPTWVAIQGVWHTWAIANGEATDAASAVISAGGGNWGSAPVLSARVRNDPSQVLAKLYITAGAGAGQNAGNLEVTLPRPCRFTAGSPQRLGSGSYMNAAGSIFAPFIVEAISAAKGRMLYPGTFNGPITVVTNALPFAFAANVVLALDLDYEPA